MVMVIVFFSRIAATVVPERRRERGRLLVQLQRSAGGCARLAGQLRVRAAVRLPLARVPRRHDAQDERPGQRGRLRGDAPAHGRRRRGEQEKLVYFSLSTLRSSTFFP